ncbi:MAG: PEGA domain-containing protein, partial [Lentisphaeria bacterium]|nr:PEGA domain-containing protein [Lentisphaeria bacterium]
MKTVKMILPLLLCLAVVCGCGKKVPETGKIVFSGHPALEVVYNGKTFRGNPVVLKTRPGSYNFRLGAPGHYPRFAVVTVKAGRTSEVKVELEPVVSAVLIDSEPQGARVKFR